MFSNPFIGCTNCSAGLDLAASLDFDASVQATRQSEKCVNRKKGKILPDR